MNPKKIILGGIAEHGRYYREQWQEGTIITLAGDDTFKIPTVRYTRMVEDAIAYRNYSIMAPVIKSDAEINWRDGSLFRTFPMSLHPLAMPLAIDAPFVLNPDRSGVQYGPYEDEESRDIPPNQWNTEVCERLFEKGGVFEECLLWVRTIDGIRMDKYVKEESIVLFSDQNNSDGHGNTWIPKPDISGDCCHKYPIFHLFARPDAYVSFKEARMVNRDLFNWPLLDQFFALMIGSDYEDHVLSEIYIGSPLFKAKSIEKEGFAESLNTYLDAVEDVTAIDSPEMYAFVENQLYPYLKDNEKSILSVDSEAFTKMRIYFSRLQDDNQIRVIRENGADKNIHWCHSDKETPPTSINRYRVLESSPVNIGIIKSIADQALKARELYIRFGEKNLQITVKNSCKTWDAMRDLLEAAYHFGYSTDGLQMPYLNKYLKLPTSNDVLNIEKSMLY
ncbi:MAG: hypothetical protein LUE92_06470, partial [Clostridiales bacterium]|nr:hypothetical protein [Clostridiales bacterium]